MISLFVAVSYSCFDLNSSSARAFEGIIGSVVVKDSCFVRSQTYTGQGGVMFLTGSVGLIIENTMFYMCLSTKEGGALYVSVSTGYSIQLRLLCSNKCYSTGAWFHFGYLATASDHLYSFITITGSAPSSNSFYYPFRIEGGNQTISNMNSTKNYAYAHTGYGVTNPIYGKTSFVSIYSNTAQHSIAVLFYGSSSLVTMSFINVLSNNSPNYGVIHLANGAKYHMQNSVFYGNLHYLFDHLAGTSIKVSNSFISHSSNVQRGKGTFDFSSFVSYSLQTSIPITLFKTHWCDAQIEYTWIQSFNNPNQLMKPIILFLFTL